MVTIFSRLFSGTVGKHDNIMDSMKTECAQAQAKKEPEAPRSEDKAVSHIAQALDAAQAVAQALRTTAGLTRPIA